MEFFDPKVDSAFKKLFGSQDHTRITISFLNAILEYTGDRQIVSITFNNTQRLPLSHNKKEHILDIFCTDEAGRRFIIEMQNALVPAFEKRTIYYGARAYADQLPKAAPYFDLQPVALVAITNKFTLFPDVEDYKSIYALINQKTLKHRFDDLTFAFVELGKFAKQEHELETDEDKWLFLLKEINKYDHIPMPLRHDEFGEACDLLNRMKWPEIDQEIYTKELIEAQGAEEIARRMLKAEGNEQKAREEGVELGEKRKAQEMAKKMLLRNCDLNSIMEFTGLTEEEIRSLL